MVDLKISEKNLEEKIGNPELPSLEVREFQSQEGFFYLDSKGCLVDS